MVADEEEEEDTPLAQKKRKKISSPERGSKLHRLLLYSKEGKGTLHKIS